MDVKAKITIEIDVTDFVNDNDYTFPEAEMKVQEIISDAISDDLCYPDKIKVEITND